MNKLVLKYVAAVGLAALTVASCSGGDDGGTTPAADFDVAPAISECGGFVGGGIGPKIPEPDPATYCDAERLRWNYNFETETLSLINTRVVLNCCGDHSIKVTRDGETIVVTEIDAPQASAGGARCKCNCVFDYAAEISPVKGPTPSLRIVRNVTDAEPSTQTVWEGGMDFRTPWGEEIVSTEPSLWCTPTP